MVYVTHVRLGGGTGNQHITDVRWKDPADDATGSSTTAAMVEWIETNKGVAKVTDGTNTATVGVVRETGHSPYLRTYADGKWTDNLLSLPRF